MLLENLTNSATIKKTAVAVKVMERGEWIEGERSYVCLTVADASAAKQAMCYSRDLDVLLKLQNNVAITHFYLTLLSLTNIVILNKQLKVYR